MKLLQLERIKCPLCSNPSGHKILWDFKLWFLCHQCGLNTPMRLLYQHRSIEVKHAMVNPQKT